jgi:hypothetical protein
VQNNAKIGGILSIVSGAFGVFYLLGILFIVLALSVSTIESDYFYNDYQSPDGVITAIMVFYIVVCVGMTLLGALGVVGGVYALRRRNWGLALAGAIGGTITFFPVGIPAIVFVALGKGEFETESKPAPPVQQ